MDDIYKNIEEYNANRKRKTLIVFDDMIANILSNKSLNSMEIKLFIRGTKLNISFTILFCRAKKIKTKFYILFYHENSK